ncbi:MAG TPA: VCBS repeat-containing protein [Pyrinomonadaceae bacterium]|jgi:hypothetical protein|nr:VCBS repeat-containing protein [Pyrinomonadaceae bacterium]
MHLKQTFSSLILLLFLSATCVFAECAGVYFKRNKTVQLNTPVVSSAYVDLDNDGIKDLVGDWDTFVFYKGLAGGGFNQTPVPTNDGSTFRLVIGKDLFADFNNDGLPDMIGSSYNPNNGVSKVAVYLNNGNGTFTRSAETQGVVPSPQSLIYVADINGDNRPDLVSKDGFSGPVYYWPADSGNHFGSPIPLGSDIRNLLVKDLNNDGKNDLAYTEAVNFNEFVKYGINQGNGVFNEISLPINERVHDHNASVFADINNDGRTDMVSQAYQNTSDGSRYVFSVFQFTAKGTITEKVVDITDALTRTFAELQQGYDNAPRAGDFNGDGLVDVMLFSIGTGSVLAKNEGSLNFTARRFGPAGDTTPYLGNFNADNKLDLLTVNTTSVQSYGHYSVSVKQNVCEPQGQTRIIDFDGNGQSDLAFWRPSDGLWMFYSGSGYTGFNGNVNWGSGALGDIPVPQDYDGDGYTDFAVYRNSTGYWYIYRGSDGQVVIFPFGAPGDKPVPADYDGDGRADIGVFRPSEGNWYYLPSGSPEKVIGTHWGLNGDVPLPMDYNGDGSADIAIYRPSTGSWYIWMTNDGSYYITNFGGTPGDRPIPADYDDDGGADLAMWRPNGAQNGLNWFIATAHNLWGHQLGVLGDLPFPGVVVSAAPRVFRPSNANIYFTNTNSIPFGSNSRNASWILPIE